jgi:hydrogenase expression/formation protein HypD
MTQRQLDVARELKLLHAAAADLDRPVTFMEVCGTHTMSAFRCGLHSLLPENVTMLSGPGCPVCVTAQGDIDQLVELASDHQVALCTYGDMLRVPGPRGSLETARSQGADVRVVYSTLDAVKLAVERPDLQVVFGAVGFETTAPNTAAAVLRAEQQGLQNFSVLVSHKRILPAMKALLTSGQIAVDGFLCPGHVSVIIGWECYRVLVEEFRVACVIGGFEEQLMIAALARLTELVRDRRVALLNQYHEAVTPYGNQVALDLLHQVFEASDMRWRGLGSIPDSGFTLRAAYNRFDAARRYGLGVPKDCEHKGCLCGRVITGRSTPHDCRLFGIECTPINPLGPCMVSSEGTCQAWFKYRRQRNDRGVFLPATSQSERKAVSA